MGQSRSGIPDSGLSLGAGGVGDKGCLGRRLTIKVHSAVPIEVHISEHLIQFRGHQWLPQQGRCCLLQLCHCDSSIPVPVKLGSQQISACPTRGGTIPTLVHAVLGCPHLQWSKPSHSCSRKSPWVDPPDGVSQTPSIPWPLSHHLQASGPPVGEAPLAWMGGQQGCRAAAHLTPTSHARPRPTPLERRCTALESPTCAPSPPSALGPSVPQILQSPHGHPLRTQTECHNGGLGPKKGQHEGQPLPNSASRKEHPAAMPSGG